MKQLQEDFSVVEALDLSTGVHHFVRGPSTIAYSVWEADGSILLQSLRTKTTEKKKGYARAAMVQFLELADKTGLDVDLGASPLTKDVHLGRLVAFYQSLGFELTGHSINPAGDPQMVRKAIACKTKPKSEVGQNLNPIPLNTGGIF